MNKNKEERTKIILTHRKITDAKFTLIEDKRYRRTTNLNINKNKEKEKQKKKKDVK